jgi:hypothetical protein
LIRQNELYRILFAFVKRNRQLVWYSFGRKPCGTGALAGGFLKKHRHNYMYHPALYRKHAKQGQLGSLLRAWTVGGHPVPGACPAEVSVDKTYLNALLGSQIYFLPVTPERSAATL